MGFNGTPPIIGEGQDFERIRRITGYLTGTVAGWNNAKRAEEKDRVKHPLDASEKEEAEEPGPTMQL